MFDGTRWKFTAIFESDKMAKLMSNDGGLDPGVFEAGTNLNLPNLSRGLVVYWKFDEISGSTAIDSSGWINPGVLSTSPPTWTSGQVINALQFNGTNNYVETPTGVNVNGLPTSTITVAAWINISNLGSLNTYNGIINNGWTGSPGRWYLFTNWLGDLYFGIRDSTGAVKQDGNPGDRLGINTWYHAVGVFDGEKVKVYLNGEPGSGNTVPALNRPSLYTGGLIDVGGKAATNQMDGKIDDVRIYNRALSDSEIRTLYNATK